MVEEKVILVDTNDNPIGLMNKLEAHEKAVLHRAFSVFILNDKNELMLQQRAHLKYHSPLLWTNTCCSHQRENETNIHAGTRRLREEMGFETELKEMFHLLMFTFIKIWSGHSEWVVNSIKMMTYLKKRLKILQKNVI